MSRSIIFDNVIINYDNVKTIQRIKTVIIVEFSESHQHTFEYTTQEQCDRIYRELMSLIEENFE